jgi:predicted nuclease of restriction endonuclease-like (RecB) superfamily
VVQNPDGGWEVKENNMLIQNNTYNKLIADIGGLLEKGRKAAFTSINSILVKTYWQIGKQIIEFEQKGKEKAEYGSLLLKKLSADLKTRYGKGFSKSNVYFMRLFYFKYPKFQTLSGKLSWSHYTELLSVSDDLARSFYEKQCINENWSVRELKRQRSSALFERLALSKDKKEVLKLSEKGQQIEKAEDILKDPYVFEFLDIPEDMTLSETELETKLLNKLSHFILELGKGFAFISRQHRITLNNKHYKVDLVFYHRILKCFVLIDLKISAANHTDIGQMNMYLNYFKEEENMPDDNPPIGIVLAADKDEILVEYATGSISNKLFVAKYQLYLPDKKLLEDELRYLLTEPGI